MAETTNTGRKFFIWNYTVTTSDTPIVLNQYVNSLLIRCRTAVDIYLRVSAGATPYYTIPSGGSLTLDMATSSLTPFTLTSSSGSVVVEILGTQE